MTRLILALVPALALAACDKPAVVTTEPADDMAVTTTPAESGVPAAAAVVDTADYLARAAAGDRFEIDSSKAILEKTGNADVKAFANMMIADHQKSSDELKAAARKAGLDVPPASLDPDQQGQIDAIRKTSGADADRVYLNAQRTAHAMALSLHTDYAANGTVPDLKATAGRIATVVQQHSNKLSTISIK